MHFCVKVFAIGVLETLSFTVVSFHRELLFTPTIEVVVNNQAANPAAAPEAQQHDRLLGDE